MKSQTVTCAIWDTCKVTFSSLGLLSGIFFVTVTLITIAPGWFDLQLIAIFEDPLTAFRAIIHYLLEWVFYHWIALAFDWICYYTTLLLSKVLPITPYLPDLHIPGWFKDLAIVSIVFLRIFESAYLTVPRLERENAYKSTTKEQYEAIDIAQGMFWGTIHKLVHRINDRLWNLTDFIRDRVFRTNHFVIRLIVIEFFGGLVLWGFIRLLGYSINVPLTWKVDAPVLEARRAVFLVFCVCLCTAIFGAAVFYVTNGFLYSDLKN